MLLQRLLRQGFRCCRWQAFGKVCHHNRGFDEVAINFASLGGRLAFSSVQLEMLCLP